ncbi:MAG: carboxypeptidase regulatory-like domain-containing protein [Patescibacteria group bacterium]
MIKLKYLAVLAVIFAATPVLAYVMSSTNYQIERDSINFAGGLSDSASYSGESTVGEAGTGIITSASFGLYGGYQQAATSTLTPTPTCGDGSCNGSETCSSCSADCGSCGGGGTEFTISNIVASNITTSSADISWSTNEAAICQLYWGVSVDYTGGSASEVGLASSHLSPLAGLDSDTAYHFKISCLNSSGASAVSADNTFTTLDDSAEVIPLGNVTDLRAQNGNTTTTLFWHNPTDVIFVGVIIRRSTDYFPGLDQGVMVYDGLGIPAGSEVSFPDTGLTNGTVYYYTVFAYDAARNYSSGVGVIGRPSAAELPPDELPEPPEPPIVPGYTGDLFFRDFNFFQQDQLLAMADDNVTAQTDYLILVSLPEAKALPGTDKIVLNLSVDGRIESYLFTYDPARQAFTTVISAISIAGTNYASIISLNAADETLKVVSGTVQTVAPIIEIEPSLPAAVDTVAAAVTAVRETAAVKTLARIAAAPAAQAAAAATVALSLIAMTLSIPWWNWWFLLQLIFTQPFALFWFRKGWGTVYNSITKRPIDLALVRLYDAKSDRLLASRVTDKDGRYIFLVDPGEYYLKVEKPGFDFPSELLRHIRDDGSFLDLYYGEKINVSGAGRSAIIANIPLDQQDARLTDKQILSRYSRTKLSQDLSWVGPILAFGYFLIYPSLFSSILVIVHLAVLLLFRRLSGRHRRKHWGVVYNPAGQNPVQKAITRVFSSEYGRMLEFYVTDNRGRYNFLVGNNKYYVTADKPGFGTAKTPILDLTGKKPDELTIAQDLILPELDQKTESINDEPLEPPESPTALSVAESIIEQAPIEEPAIQPTSESINKPLDSSPLPPVMPVEMPESAETPISESEVKMEPAADQSVAIPETTKKDQETIYG